MIEESIHPRPFARRVPLTIRSVRALPSSPASLPPLHCVRHTFRPRRAEAEAETSQPSPARLSYSARKFWLAITHRRRPRGAFGAHASQCGTSRNASLNAFSAGPESASFFSPPPPPKKLAPPLTTGAAVVVLVLVAAAVVVVVVAAAPPSSRDVCPRPYRTTPLTCSATLTQSPLSGLAAVVSPGPDGWPAPKDGCTGCASKLRTS